ncbi:quercetin 2,3-dioxygenase [Aureococcus anophagefferens]|nr:quercetin 2,3-dioxygenase [Aureococcus anophagefferens]
MMKKRTPRKTPRKTPRHRSVSPEPDWVDALGTLEDPSKTPRAWEAEPVSVGVVRKHYRLRRQGEEAAARARVRRDNELRASFAGPARADGAMSSSSDDDDDEASKPVVVDDPEITKLYGLAYGAVANDAERRASRASAELRSGGPVLLVAHPDDNDGEAANCRLVLRTLHAACNPTLTDPIARALGARTAPSR